MECRGILQVFEMEPDAHTLPRKLSQGSQRILAVAITLLSERNVIIVDEPTRGLDPNNRRKMWRVIRVIIFYQILNRNWLAKAAYTLKGY